MAGMELHPGEEDRGGEDGHGGYLMGLMGVMGLMGLMGGEGIESFRMGWGFQGGGLEQFPDKDPDEVAAQDELGRRAYELLSFSFSRN